VDLRKIAFHAISCNATRVILCHNHPGGTNSPSNEDTCLTQNIVNMMKHFNIAVVEHIIIAGDTYFSFLEEGLL
nr:DNA repair protein RadC [Bacteroidales bacterium]